MTADPWKHSVVRIKGRVLRISTSTAGSLVICPPKIPTTMPHKAVTEAEILNVHLRSCLTVGIAASMLKVDTDVSPTSIGSGGPSKAGKKAWDREEPTSPKTMQTMATENNAV